MRPLRLVAGAVALASRVVSSTELEQFHSLPPGSLKRATGVRTRRYVAGETASQLGARAGRLALERAGGSPPDVIVAACATYEQALPYRASLMQKELGLPGIPSFDVDCSCLSFLVALDRLADSFASGRFGRALVISSEVASAGLDWTCPESAGLFGDGAAAFVVERGEPGLLACTMESHPEGWDWCQIPGGGTRVHPRQHGPETERQFLFQMNGPRLYKLAAERLPAVLELALAEAGCRREELALVIPHQASPGALRLMERRLGLRGRFFNQVEETGNLVAASLPTALLQAIEGGRLRRGDLFAMLGTSAGVSLAAMILRY